MSSRSLTRERVDSVQVGAIDAKAEQPCVVTLYLAVPAADETAAACAKPSIRRRLARWFDIFRAFIPGQTEFRFHAWNAEGTNKGDIAIREAIKAQIAEAMAPRPVTFSEIGWGRLTERAIETINETSELFVIAGSGYLFPHFGSMPQRIIRDAQEIPKIGCRKIAYSIGWNTLVGEDAPLDGPSRNALCDLFAGFEAISVRDYDTQQRVQDAIKRAVLVTADPVLFHSAYIDGARWRWTRPTKSRRMKIGINIACHGPFSAQNVKRDFPKIVKLLRSLRARYDAELHFISHSAPDRIVWWLLTARGIRIKFRRAGVYEMPAVYSEMDLMLGQMMHSTIFATGACIPTVAIGYDIKLKNFLSLMGLDEYLLNITDWSEGDVLGLLEKAHTNSTNIRCAIAKRKAELATNELTFLAALPQTLEAAA
jgi:hypothetical protein